MARDSSGTQNQPQYSTAGIPADAADLSEIANYAAAGGNTKFGTTTQMNALAGADLWTGLLFSNTTDKGLYRYDGGWQNITRRMIGVGVGLFGGTPPVNATFLEQAGYALVNTQASGDASLVFPAAFPTGVLAVSLDRINFTNFGTTTHVFNTTQSLTQCNFRVYAGGTAQLNLTGVPYMFRAIGW